MLIELNQVIPEPIPKEMIERSEVWGTQLKIEPRTFNLISAHSGKGKSTLLHLLYGLRKDFSGEVIMDGENIQKQTTYNWTSLRSTQIALLFQELKLFPKLCACENIELIPQINQNVPSGLEMAKQLGMEGFLTKPVETLSFGQRQRIALIRTLRKPFKLLLLDEPFSHLDQENTDLASNLINEIARTNQATVLLTSLGETPPLVIDRILSL
ncbi:MAG: ATP-binding cassette domain-containing protein [Opitutae bacterium]|jgi:putative ABC transport system ATP-binding protein|nr:ATP-binding cassette domain-containing protein [Opitutae bacterium]MDA8823003.1 ATP-binding cassette domain-containing protein [Opitutales bacterium]